MSEWPMVKLKELMRKTKSIDPGKYPDEEFVLYSIPAYDNGIPEKIFGRDIGSSKILLKDSDVVLSKIVPHIRRTWVITDGEKQIGSSEWIVFNDDRFDPQFIANYLKSDVFHYQLLTTVAGVGGSLNRARPAAVAELKIPLPPLGEQKRIAEFLGGVSKAIQKTKVQLLLVDSLGENKYLSLSKDADTFKSLKDLGVKKITGKSIVAKPDNEHGVNQIIKVSAVSSGRFIASESKPLPADYEPNNLHEIHQGDLLFARASGSANLLGACCIVDKEIQHLYLPDKVWKLEVDEDILPKVYLLQALRGREFRSVAESHFSSSTGVKNIKTSVLMEFKIPVLKQDQLNDYVHFVKTLDNLRHLLHRKLSLLQELQKSLSSRAFAGLL